MTQEIITYLLIGGAAFYVARKFYTRLKKQEGCDKCELMKAVKKT